MYKAYTAAGYSPSDTVSAVNASLDKKAAVSLLGGKDVTSHSKIYYGFSYLGWLLLILIILGVAPVLQVFSREEIQKRIQCSAYKFNNFNCELFLASIVTGLFICGIIFIAITIIFKGSTLSFAGSLYALNMICYMLVSLSFAFLISKLTTNDAIMNMIANTISLGMAFLCGIFVPEEFLGDNIIKISHFLPAYWYTQAVKNIDFHLQKSLPDIFMCMGIQLLFALAIAIIAIRISKTTLRHR